jgi:hypothetical protein
MEIDGSGVKDSDKMQRAFIPVPALRHGERSVAIQGKGGSELLPPRFFGGKAHGRHTAGSLPFVRDDGGRWAMSMDQAGCLGIERLEILIVI